MRLKSQKLFEINSSLEKLFSQQVDLPLSVGYAVFKKKKEIQDICQYIADRISMVIPAEHMQSNELNEDESALFLKKWYPVKYKAFYTGLAFMHLHEKIKKLTNKG